MGKTSVRPFDPHRDRAAVARLWAAAFDDDWPVLPDALGLLGAGYVTQVDRSVAGMVGYDPLGSILLLAVHPDHRRQGHGSLLVDHALADIRAAGSISVRLGAGGDRYIWPGLPTSCGEAAGFFERRGWSEDHVTTDLVQDLRSPGLADRMAAHPPPDDIDVGPAGPRLMADVVAFEDTHFPQWSRYFREPHDGVLIARERSGGGIVGSLLLDGPGRQATPYWPILGEDAGAIGCVGVHPDQEGRGVGTAMVAAATTLLATRGVHHCLIDWVVRVAFYARLGYQPYRQYSMRTREL